MAYRGLSDGTWSHPASKSTMNNNNALLIVVSFTLSERCIWQFRSCAYVQSLTQTFRKTINCYSSRLCFCHILDWCFNAFTSSGNCVARLVISPGPVSKLTKSRESLGANFSPRITGLPSNFHLSSRASRHSGFEASCAYITGHASSLRCFPGEQSGPRRWINRSSVKLS